MKKTKFKKVFNSNNSYYSKYLIAYISSSEEKDIGIIVSKKIGNSVVRHRYTRLIREIFRLNIENIIHGYDIIIIAKKSICNVDFWELQKDFINLMKRCKIYEEITDKIN